MTLFSLAGSLDHVNPTAQPESGSERKTSDTCGPKCLEQFERFNHVGSWAKTFSALLIGTEGWYSTRCKLTWKLKGTKFNRLYFQLQASTHRTEGTEFGLLPTEGMLPTPTAVQRDHPERVQALRETGATDIYSRNNGENRPNSILDYMNFHQMLPTPTADDNPEKNTGKRNQDGLQKRAFQTTGKTSQLNPRFVAEMMGFPPNWTELPFLSGETNQSRPPETPSCPK